jgi:hypothetical protein
VRFKLGVSVLFRVKRVDLANGALVDCENKLHVILPERCFSKIVPFYFQFSMIWNQLVFDESIEGLVDLGLEFLLLFC